eukprot:Gb_41024 [translate_table: standard]
MASNINSNRMTLSTRIACVFTLFFINADAQGFDFFYLVQQSQDAAIRPQASLPQISRFMAYGQTLTMEIIPPIATPTIPSILHRVCFDFDKYILTMGMEPMQISDLRSEMGKEWFSLACPSSNGNSFWAHEWDKHGTCSESVLGQHDYFQAALLLKESVDVLGTLEDSGIHPDGNQYSLDSIQNALTGGVENAAGIECNRDESGNDQLYQAYLCVDTSASKLITCPVLPPSKCSSRIIIFPSF